MVMPNVRWHSEVQSITNAEVALMDSAQETPCTKRANCSMGPLDRPMNSRQPATPQASAAPTVGLRPDASDSDPAKNRTESTPNRYMTMVMETSEAERPSCCCHVAYSGMGAEAAANTVTKATVPTMAPRIAPGGWLAACSSIPIGFPFPIPEYFPV